MPSFTLVEDPNQRGVAYNLIHHSPYDISLSSMPHTYGVMQGRLAPPEDGRFQSFPRRSWREEFPRAREAALDYIEWIHDEYGRTANPIFSQADLAEFDVLKCQYGIARSEEHTSELQSL